MSANGMIHRSQWMLYTKQADFHAIAKHFQIDPVTARLIRNRDIVGEQEIWTYLHGSLRDLHDPMLLKGMEQAVKLLGEAVKKKKKIRIVGDYDIDGVCATYLLYQGIRQCGGVVDFRIPERIRDGYGINETIIEQAAADGIEMIVTCDNGIAALEQIDRARALGLVVIVTDHHEVVRDEEGGQCLPNAHAVVNPKQDGCEYPFRDICGGVVAYKLVQALFRSVGISEVLCEEMLEFAAIATVGDVMRLQGENRIIVKLGLERAPKTKSLGLLALVRACDLDIEALTAYQIGFVIGPCLNASGRLRTAQLALKLLLCEDEAEAETMAAELKQLNEERKDMTQKGVEEALEQIERRFTEDSVLVVYLPDCHESLAGIIAGRVREAWNRPVFVLTKGEGCVKGSGRSIEAYHMYQALCQVKELLVKFGGHPMAAGFSLREEDVEIFRKKLNQQAKLKPEDFVPRIWIDVPMPFEYVSEPLIQEWELLEPFGQGNEKPLFAQKNLRVRSARVVGRNRNAVKLSLVTETGLAVDGMLFTEGDRFLEELGKQERKIMDVIYYPDINEFRGKRNLQMIVREYKLQQPSNMQKCVI